MKFRKGNRYRYGQDFKYYKGIPHGIDFKVENGNIIKLTAFGHGEPGDGYGNGPIYISDPKVKKRILERKNNNEYT